MLIHCCHRPEAHYRPPLNSTFPTFRSWGHVEACCELRHFHVINHSLPIFMRLFIGTMFDCEWVLWNILGIVNVPRINVVGMLIIDNKIVKHDASFDHNWHGICILHIQQTTSRHEDVETSLDPKRSFNVILISPWALENIFCIRVAGFGNVLTKHAYVE